MTALKAAIFEGKKIRRHWDEKNELWYFSIVDIVTVLTDSVDPGAYWRKLKERLRAEGSESVTKCHGFKMRAADGKMRVTDMADTENLLRLIQSIPSPNAEPFKLWLARVGYERLEETADPELAINRALKTYLRKGYSRGWINQRLRSIEIRKSLTDEWEDHGVNEGREFAILTDIISKAWSGMKTKQYKKFKNLKKENLRDNMTNIELVFSMLGEAATTEITKAENPKGFEENKKTSKRGGTIAGNAKKELEKITGEKVTTKDNYLNLPKKSRLLK